MQTLHLHKNKNTLYLLLLFIPIIIFGLILFSFVILKGNLNNEEIATESHPNLGVSGNNTWVLGDQNDIETSKYKLVK